MKLRLLAIAIGCVLLTGLVPLRAANPSAKRAREAAATFDPLLSPMAAKAVLDSTPRHREWIHVAVGSTTVWAFLVYPQRSNKAAVVVVTGKDQGASDWIRAVSDDVAAHGFIAIVPDVLSGLGPGGGDTDSFPNPKAISAALGRLGSEGIARRTSAVREFAVALPAANGRSASIELDAPEARIETSVDSPSAPLRANFQLSGQSWGQALALLAKETGNDFGNDSINDSAFGANLQPLEHAGHDHMAMMMAMAQADGGRSDRVGSQNESASLATKRPDLPAGYYTAESAVAHSKLRKEWVDIPLGDLKLHTRIEYPAGNDKAAVVIVMQHGTGLDNWMLGVVDQLASQGFIAVAPDIWSGTGPNGGNRDSFQFTDAAIKAASKITQDEAQRRYKAAREYALKLPRANGKTASLGFCAGGDNSFRFAGEVPDLDAAVVFYGSAPAESIMANIKAPVLGLYGENDARVTSTVEPTIAAMKRLGKSYEPHIYPKTTHSFVMFQDAGGNPEAIRDAWPRAIAFLKQHTS